jgi:hypothetical protein
MYRLYLAWSLSPFVDFEAALEEEVGVVVAMWQDEKPAGQPELVGTRSAVVFVEAPVAVVAAKCRAYGCNQM